MGIRRYNPTTPGRRGASVSDFAELTDRREAANGRCCVPKKKKGGRNNQGVITSRHRGGGHKRCYRVVDFRRTKDGVPAKVHSIQYDPNRSARIALLYFADGEKAYILAPGRLEGRRRNHERTGRAADGGQLPAIAKRSAGYGRSQHRNAAGPRRPPVPLGRQQCHAWWPARPIGHRSRCPAVKSAASLRLVEPRIGQIGNADHMNVVIGKAGRNRWKGIRPHVRGTAMNPIDHPHGGGEGRTKGGRHPVSPTGKSAKGGQTRKRRKPSNSAIIRRRRSRRYGQLKIK